MKETSDKRPHIIWYSLYEMPRIGQSIEVKSILLAALGQWGVCWMGGTTATGNTVSSGDDKNVPELDYGDCCTRL